MCFALYKLHTLLSLCTLLVRALFTSEVLYQHLYAFYCYRMHYYLECGALLFMYHLCFFFNLTNIFFKKTTVIFDICFFSTKTHKCESPELATIFVHTLYIVKCAACAFPS